ERLPLSFEAKGVSVGRGERRGALHSGALGGGRFAGLALVLGPSAWLLCRRLTVVGAWLLAGDLAIVGAWLLGRRLTIVGAGLLGRCLAAVVRRVLAVGIAAAARVARIRVGRGGFCRFARRGRRWRVR